MKLRIRPSHSDWDDLNELFPDNKETVTEDNILTFCLLVIGIGLIVVAFIVVISL
jgi:hypothetical protein|nr:hypothetical protein [uncultured Flavobacterium sp.]